MDQLSPYVIATVEKMMQCREPKQIGYHKYACPNHPDRIRIVPHSCKTNICSSCAKIQSDIWSEQLKEFFPVVRYLHITFTMPQEFRVFFGEEDADWKRKSDLYDLAWQAIRGFCKSQKGILTGCFSTLHTFGRDLKVNPHLHVVMPAGGLALNEQGEPSWQELDHLPRNYLGKAWKLNLLRYILERTPFFSSYIDQVMYLYQSRSSEDYARLLKLLKSIAPTKEEYEKWVKVFQVNYYVNVSQKRSYKQTVSYAVRYNRRLPIAKSRILAFDQDKATVTWQYQPHDGALVTVIMPAFDFMDKLIRHIRPKNFRLVRYSGIFAQKNLNQFKPILQKVCRFSPPQRVPTWRERQLAYTGQDPLICPCCKKELQLVEKAFSNGSDGLKVVPVFYN